MNTLSVQDQELVAAAQHIIKQRFREGYHHIGAALRTQQGQTFTGVHLEANIGRIAVCGEAIALGAAATAGDTHIDTIVAVNPMGQVVSPCGMCREMILDYAPDARIILRLHGEVRSVPAQELLPQKYKYVPEDEA